jgi:hypothetical protein
VKTTFITVAICTATVLVSAQKPYSAPRTPWGHPDLQGTWTTDDARSVPLQRTPEFGDRRLLTDQEYADRKRRDDDTRGDVRIAAGTFVGEVGTRTQAISHEMIHETRLIPIDGHRPGDALHAYMGYSSGRWAGDTLVIEAAGFTNTTALAGTRHSDTLRVVERLTRTADDTITYEATVTDPDTWTAPWKVSVPLTTQSGYQVYPYECHEGNNALRNMLSAARAEEKVIEEYVKKGLPPPPLARPNDGEILPADPSFGRRR